MSKLKVLYNFTAEDEGELTVLTGEVLEDMTQLGGKMGVDNSPEGWILVKSAKNLIGFVPRNYVEEVSVRTLTNNRDNNSKISRELTIDAVDALSSPKPALNNLDNSAESFNKPSSTPQISAPNSMSNPGNSNNLYSFDSKGNTNGSFTTSNYLRPRSTTPISSLSKTRNLSAERKQKLLNAAKTVTSLVKPVQQFNLQLSNATIKAPPLHEAAEKANYHEIIGETEAYLNKLSSYMTDHVESFQKLLDDASNTVNISVECSAELMTKLSNLEEMIENEKRRIKQNYDTERSDMMSISFKSLPPSPQKGSSLSR